MTRLMIARAVPVAGREAELKALVETLAQAVHAEPGNIRFEAHAERDGDAVVMVEEYRDDAAFQSHLSMPHTKDFNTALKDVAEGGGSSVTELAGLGGPRPAAPAIRAIDHVGLTVPDVDAATTFLAEAFGAVTLYDVQPKDAEPMAGEGPQAELGLTEGTKIVHMRLMRIGDGPCLEIFAMTDGEQRYAPRLQDYGLTHFAIYVDDMDAAVAAFKAAGGTLLAGPHPLAGVEDGANNSGIYGRAPWGMLIELLTYPDGIDYPQDAPAVRWTPHP